MTLNRIYLISVPKSQYIAKKKNPSTYGGQKHHSVDAIKKPSKLKCRLSSKKRVAPTNKNEENENSFQLISIV